MINKFFLRFFFYSLVILALSALFAGIKGGVAALLLLGLFLAAVNTVIRPVLSLLALPFNLITFGIAGVFVNMITIAIADAFAFGASVHGFLLKLFVAVAIMLTDGFIRSLRRK